MHGPVRGHRQRLRPHWRRGLPGPSRHRGHRPRLRCAARLDAQDPPRSGLKFTYGVEAFSGVIDSDFRGSVRVLLESAGDHYEIPSLRINPGDRVAQASLVPAPRVTFTVVEQMSLTERGAGGFGHSGR